MKPSKVHVWACGLVCLYFVFVGAYACVCRLTFAYLDAQKILRCYSICTRQGSHIGLLANCAECRHSLGAHRGRGKVLTRDLTLRHISVASGGFQAGILSNSNSSSMLELYNVLLAVHVARLLSSVLRSTATRSFGASRVSAEL